MNGPSSQSEESGAKPVTLPVLKTRRALSRLTRELSESELSTTGVQKMLLEDLERLEEENLDLRSFREKFNASDKELAVAKEKMKGWTSMEVISTAGIAVGAAALGYVPEAWKNQPTGWIALVFGGILVVVGILAKKFGYDVGNSILSRRRRYRKGASGN